MNFAMPSELQANTTTQSSQTSREKPDWAGEDLLSRIVNTLIKTKPIYALMKQQARQVLIKTAEKNGIPWRDNTQSLLNSGVKDRLKDFTNPAVTYPDYYNVPFHAYNSGNLCWEAAAECESATYSMALRVWKNEPLTAPQAQAKLRSSFHQALAQRGITEAQDILDVGCSVGISTKTIHEYYKKQSNQTPRTIGLDLSPYMLAIAAQQDPNHLVSQWIHGRAEATGFEAEKFDLVTLQFVLHELPRSATLKIFKEMYRILKPGSHIAIVDNNPKSTVIQNLPPVLFTLMKSTEPWTDDYYTFDVEMALLEAGFSAVSTVESDPRHRTITAQKTACV
jgi:ubiquinone/menaquinone biosynthesis C-methylase UbiE